MASAAFRILASTRRWVAIEKPSGFHVHPHEDPTIRVPQHRNCLRLLKNQLGQWIYPVHRLDAATSGVLLFALDPDAASHLGAAFADGRVNKTYFALVRGWLGQEIDIDHPLDGKEARTLVKPLGRTELPIANRRFSTSRYSLVEANPVHGRTHQIRRHLRHVAHPLVGDTIYGDGVHNRAFRDLGLRGLFLKAAELRFPDPETGLEARVISRWDGRWHQAFDRIGVCPWLPQPRQS